MPQGPVTVRRPKTRSRIMDRSPRQKPEETRAADRTAGPQERLSDKVYQFVVQKVMSGRLPPSTRITEQSLAAMVGVSPAPVREAMENSSRTGGSKKSPTPGRSSSGSTVRGSRTSASFVKSWNWGR